MIVLDSIGGTRSAAVSNIRHYLAAEWKAKMCGDEEEFEFSSKEMRTVRPAKPEQENYTDCGIYLLQYIEKMFTRFVILLSCHILSLNHFLVLPNITGLVRLKI